MFNLRSHLVYVCKKSKLKTYEIEGLPPEALAVEVENLLKLDRFTCRREKREVYYYILTVGGPLTMSFTRSCKIASEHKK